MSENYGTNTVLEWLDRIPVMRPEMVMGRSHVKPSKVKITLARESVMVRSSFIQSTPLWLIVITKVKGSHNATFHRCRVWLRTVEGGLLSIEDQSGFVTVRGAEWCAYRILNKITRDMLDAEAEFEKKVTSP